MALNNSQRKIMDALFASGSQSIKQLSMSTGYSPSFLRIQLELMKSELVIDKTRQPYTYDVAPESTEMRTRRLVEQVKLELMNKKETSNSFVKMIRGGPKEVWPDVVPSLRAIAQAIEELAADGELIDTLGS